MEQWADIRRRVLTGSASKRQILAETAMHWTTLEKILTHSEPPGYRMEVPRSKPKLDEHLPWIREIIQTDKGMPPKQRHTAKKIWIRLCEERGFTGGYTIVREAVRDIKRTSKEVFMPLRHEPGEAQVDFFFALVNLMGVLRKIAFFCMALPYSDMFFVMACVRECTETFWEGHKRAFEFFGGVPKRITYDNSRVAVTSITGCHERVLTDGFLQLSSHYLFDHHFCTVLRANEKGVVEGICKYGRSNFLVPVPQVNSLDELNEMLSKHCRSDGSRRLRGKGARKIDLLKDEEFLPIPAGVFDACRKQKGASNSLSLVRFDDNDYSVPVRWAHRDVVVKGYVDRVEIYTLSGEKIASHTRLWGKESESYDPLHYIPLLERKPGALDYAEPLFGFNLPRCFDALRRKLEGLNGHAGTKEYIRVLSFIEPFSMERVKSAIQKALPLQRPNADMIKLYCMPEESPEASTFRLDEREHLRGVHVGAPDLDAYAALMANGEGAA
jgi:transposase